MQYDTPYVLQLLSAELTKNVWYKYLGIGLNVLDEGEVTSKGPIYGKNVWYTMGKGASFMPVQSYGPTVNKNVMSFDAGTLSVESINEKDLITGEETKLKISYDLSIPVKISKGASYLTLVTNAPISNLKVGQSLKLSFWCKGQIVKANIPNLLTTGYFSTYGGDIFSEHIARPFLSYCPPNYIHQLESYQITNEEGSIDLKSTETQKYAEKIKGIKRQHAADSVKGLAIKQGFYITNEWRKITLDVGYTLDEKDIQSRTISAEICIQLPYTTTGNIEWDSIEGNIQLAGIKWWVD